MESNDGDPSKVATSETTKTTPTVLSKSQVYQTLKGIDNDNISASAPSNQKLFSFCQSLSQNYHSAATLDGLSTGGRPLTTDNYQAAFQNNAVTLWDGFYSQSSTGTDRRKRPFGRKKRKLRPRKLSPGSSSIQPSDTAFLEPLNTLWNDYARAVIDKDTIHASVDAIEWVGSRVRIVRCPRYRNYESQLGILIGDFSDDWKVVVIVHPSGSSTTKKARILRLPKRNSQLEVLVPTTDEPDGETLCLSLEGAARK